MNRFGLLSCITALALCSSIAQAQNPIGVWQGEGNAFDAVGGNNAALQGGVKYGQGVVGQCFEFDGTEGVVRLPDADTLKFTKSFSISAWVNVAALPDNPTGYGQIFFRGDSRGGYDPYFLAVHNSGNIVFHIGTDANRYVEIAAPMPLKQFVYVTASFDDKTGLLRLGLNNRLVAQAVTDIRPFRDLLPDWSPGVGIGNTQDAGINEPFNGKIDEVQIYDTVIGPTSPLFAVETPFDFRQAMTGTHPLRRVPRSHTFEIDVKALVDGHSLLLLKGNQLLWHHLEHAAPGHIDGNNLPTIISTKLDGVELLREQQWTPNWPKAQDRDVTNETYSDAIPLYIPELALPSTLVTLQTITDREGLRLYVPTGANADTLTLDFDDNSNGGAAWYEAKLIFTFADIPAQGTILTGAAALEGITDLSEAIPPAEPLTFEFCAPGTLLPVLPLMTASLEPVFGTPYGTFHLSIPPGTYDIAVKEGRTLRHVFPNVTVNGETTLTTPKGYPLVLTTRRLETTQKR